MLQLYLSNGGLILGLTEAELQGESLEFRLARKVDKLAIVIGASEPEILAQLEAKGFTIPEKARRSAEA